MLKLQKSEINAAIVNNPANAQYQWSTHLCPETGNLVNLSSTENGSLYETLIPLPSMDPEGSGEELDRFDEFSQHPPANIKLMSYHEFQSSDEIPKYDPDRYGYIEYAKDSGWDSIETDWDTSESEHLDFIRDAWISGLKTGNLDSVNSFETVSPVEIVLV